MNFGPLARIVLRYGIGYLAGSELGEQLASDQDIQMGVAVGLGAIVEGCYGLAKRKGWAT